METLGATVVITTYNQKQTLALCLEWLQGVSGIADIIIVDNGSTDGTSEMLAEIRGGGYIYFDEGFQSYGKVWNAVVDNFPMSEIIVFMEPQFILGNACIVRLMEVLQQEKCGIAAPMCNGFDGYQYMDIDTVEHLLRQEKALAAEEGTNFRSLDIAHGVWAVSREALEENGKFEELLGDPKNVFLDYKMRLVKKGYPFRVCGRALAFDSLCGRGKPYAPVVSEKDDREVLKSKWQMNYFNLAPNRNLTNLIEEEKDAPIRVLEIGCDLGATLLEIKNKFPNSQLYGLEINKPAVDIAKHLAQVKVGNIEDKELPFEGTFDYILFGDVLEHLRDPQGVVRYCREKLNEHGAVLACIPNLMYISVMRQLINGRFQYEDTGLLDRSHIHFFAYYQIILMFQEEGYTVEEMRNIAPPFTPEDAQLARKLLELSKGTDLHMYQTFQYLVRARK